MGNPEKLQNMLSIERSAAGCLQVVSKLSPGCLQVVRPEAMNEQVEIKHDLSGRPALASTLVW